MKDQYRYFVIETNCSNPNDDDVTHLAVEIQPGAVWRLALANLLVRLLYIFLGRKDLFNLVIPFKDAVWLNWNPIDEDHPARWIEGVVVDQLDPEWLADCKLDSSFVMIAGDGFLMFTVNHEYHGGEHYSYEVRLHELIKVIRWCDLRAELSAWWIRIDPFQQTGEPSCAA